MLNHRPLITGDVLNIRVKPEDVEKTRLMIEIQWLALKMVAFCAAAEVIDELDSEPPHLQELSTYWDPEETLLAWSRGTLPFLQRYAASGIFPRV